MVFKSFLKMTDFHTRTDLTEKVCIKLYYSKNLIIILYKRFIYKNFIFNIVNLLTGDCHDAAKHLLTVRQL